MQPMKKGLNPIKDEKGLGSGIVGERYAYLGIIGSGSYGEVFKVRSKDNKKLYAVKRYKKIFTNRILALRTLRELMILRRINNDRIIKIYDIIPPENIDNYDSLGVVIEYLPFDLKKLCEINKFLNDEHIPKIMYQLLVALKYLNSVKVLHRDLKPENILSDQDYNIKICDFGLARPGVNEKSFTELSNIVIDVNVKPINLMTCHVVSRWYRAPELILMQTKYDSAIEMWSVGCIMGELIAEHVNNKKLEVNRSRRALFEGKACFPLSPPKKQQAGLYRVENGFPQSEDDQLSKIFRFIGTPTESEASFIEEALAVNYIRSLPKYPKKRACDIFDYCRPEWENFLDHALVFDPRKRMSIDEALEHPIFDKIRNPADYNFGQEINFDLFLPSDMPMDQIRDKLKEQILYYQKQKMEEEK